MDSWPNEDVDFSAIIVVVTVVVLDELAVNVHPGGREFCNCIGDLYGVLHGARVENAGELIVCCS